MQLALVVLLVAAGVALVAWAVRRRSLGSRYAAEVTARLTPTREPRIVTERDLATLPPAVATYLRRAGVVGKPRVHDLRVRFRAEMKMSPDAPWMKAEAEQVEIFDGTATRLFFMGGSRKGVPFAAFHRFVDGAATMQVRAASLFDVAFARGPEMNQSETVTLFNDMCLFAPATLVDADVTWTRVGERKVHATFRSAGVAISAYLVFDEAGDLVDFISYDRFMSADGKTYERHPWETPIREHREIGGVRVVSRGEALWRRPEGDFVYIRLEVEELAYNVASRPSPRLVLVSAH